MLLLSGGTTMILLLLPLRRKLRVPLLWGTALLVGALVLASIPAFIMGYDPFSQSYYLGALVNTVMLVAASVSMLYLLTGTRFFQLLFLLLLTKSYGEYVLTLSLLCYRTFFRQYGIYSVLLCMMGCYLLTLPLMMLFFAKLVRPLMEEGGSLPFWRYLWLMPTGFYAVYCLAVYTDYLGSVGMSTSYMGLVILLFWMLGTFATYFIIVKMLSITVTAAQMREQLAVSELQNEIQHQRLASLQSSIEETRRTRHDLRHHVTMLRTMLQRGNLADARNYLDQLADSAPPALEQAFCENQAVDALLGYYLSRCQQQQIAADIAVTVPRDLDGMEKDVCVVLSNLLENACEACARQKQGARTLRVRAHLCGGNMLALTVRNSFDGPARTDQEGRFLSSKRGGQTPGIGTQSVRSIAAKTGGAARLSFTDREFTASVLLHL